MVMVQICDNPPSLGVQLSAGSAEAGGAAVPLAETHHVGDNAGVPEPCPRASLSVHFNDAAEYLEQVPEGASAVSSTSNSVIPLPKLELEDPNQIPECLIVDG